MRALNIQSKNLLNMKIVVNYLNFVFHTEVNTKSKYKILNFVYQKTIWHFGYPDYTYFEKRLRAAASELKVACRIQIWKKTFFQNSEKFKRKSKMTLFTGIYLLIYTLIFSVT